MTEDKKKPTMYLVDGNNYAYRAFYAIQGLSNSRGFPTNAVYGFNNMLMKLVREYVPDYIIVVFDSKGPTFRDEVYDQYKAHRLPMPDALIPQFPVIKDLIRAYAIPILEKEGLEADDIIGTLAKRFAAQGMKTVIVSGDKDLMQLVSENISMADTMKDKVYDREGVFARFGVEPEKVPEIMGLTGDTSDNIPGVPGIGPKTALSLIREHGTLEGVLQNTRKVKNEKIRRALETFADQARLSRDLARVKTDADVALEMESARYSGPDREALRAIFKEMEFSSLLQNLNVSEEAENGRYNLILTDEDWQDLLVKLKGTGEFSFSLELTSPVPMTAAVAGVSICLSPGEAWYVPLGRGSKFETAYALKGLAAHLADGKIQKVGHDLKTALIVLSRYGAETKGIHLDTMVASYVLNPSKKSHDLTEVVRDHLNREMISEKDVMGSGAKVLSPAEIVPEKMRDYACQKSDTVLRLSPVLMEKIRKDHLEDLFRQVELPLVGVLAGMERHGVLVDVNLLSEMSHQFENLLSQSEDKIYRLAGEKFNINSPKQLQYILFEKLGLARGKKTKEGYSTDVEVLTALALRYELPAEILAYRSIAKLKSTYIDALPSMINGETGRIHTSYNQTVTATGRLSSSNPNLQNIPIRTPEGKRIRQAFVAPKGFVIVSADYSQIELHILAHLSGDETLIGIFEAGEDVHTMTAAGMFGVFPEMVTADMRRQAKVVNFGILYGMSPFGLSKELGISQIDAKAYIDGYFKRFKGVREYLDRILENARRDKYVCTLLNRRRYIPEIASPNNAIRQFAERTAINAPIQGTAADLIKIAMINLANLIKKNGSRSAMIMQVHDELVFEVPVEEKEEMLAIIKREMEGVIQLRVPLKVEIAAGRNWDEAH